MDDDHAVLTDDDGEIGAAGLKVTPTGSGRVARPFAWAAGLTMTVVAFIEEALPPTTLRFVEPYLDYKWVELDQVLKVEPAAPFVTTLNIAIGVLIMTWFLLRWVNVRGARTASMNVDHEKIVLRFKSGWPKTKEVALADVATALAPSEDTLEIHLYTGSSLVVTTARAVELAGAIERRRRAAAALPAGLGWHAIPLGGLLRWGWALGGLMVVMGAAKAAGRATAMGSFMAGPFAAALMLIWLIIGFTLSSRTTMVVGTDGVRVSHPWRTQFVPYHQVDDVVEKAGVVRLVRKDGRDFFISSKNTKRLVQDVREALDRYHNPEASTVDHHLDELSRGERSDEQWRDDLLRLLGQQDYRGPKLRVQDLVALVGDGQADPEQRVAAALALPKDEATRKRIRVAAEQSADEDTRAAIAAAAEDEVAADELARAARKFRQG
ncbi:MAG TPA: hypothetical protein ENK57_14520 [Polyangiaceae bacterium]|nr:hypothetical protein [Polyangiaceae bacterium]